VEELVAAAASANGNGKISANGANGKYSNGASNGAAAASTILATAAANGKVSLNGGGGGAAAAKQQPEDKDRVLNTIDEEQNAAAAGKLELAAVTEGEGAGGGSARTAAGTPYRSPGGRWSKFKSYGVWQVRRHVGHAGRVICVCVGVGLGEHQQVLVGRAASSQAAELKVTRSSLLGTLPPPPQKNLSTTTPPLPPRTHPTAHL